MSTASSWAASPHTNGDAEDFPSSRQILGHPENMELLRKFMPEGVTSSGCTTTKL